MLNLDQEIAEWREAMARGGINSPAVLDELESHLRDFIAQEVKAGRDVQLAFQAGLERIGSASVLRREFSRANPIPILTGLSALLRDRRKYFWTALVLSLLAAGGFYNWKARITPVYLGIAGLLLDIRPSNVSAISLKLDARSAEELRAAIKILSSQTLRTLVAKSLTPTEQEIVRRTTAVRPAVGEPASVRDLLGSLTLQTRWASGGITLLVLHEDAEAAALIANRYAEQCVLYLAKVSRDEASSVPRFLVLDRAIPSRWPAAPQRASILLASAALAFGVFVGLLVIAAALRKLTSIGLPPGPQAATT